MDSLTHLLGAYFYELWDEHEYTSWQEAIDDFVGRSPTRATSVPDEIDSLLSVAESEEELATDISAMGCAYLPPEGYRPWLGAVRDRILHATPSAS